jgi:hypothetical protein
MSKGFINPPNIVVIQQATVLPYVIQSLTKTNDAIIAAAIFIADGLSGAVTQSLYNTLTQISFSLATPVIPAFIVADSQSQAINLIPTISESWIAATIDVLQVDEIIKCGTVISHFKVPESSFDFDVSENVLPNRFNKKRKNIVLSIFEVFKFYSLFIVLIFVINHL